jgi:DNA-binding NarL/FixJ family response regulator
MIRILIVDDHRMVRLGLDMLLKSAEDMAVVGHASNGIEALDLCKNLHPDVILMDIAMPEMDGITATRIIHQAHPTTRVVMLTSLNDAEKCRAATRAGAEDLLPKNAPIDVILDTVRAVYRGS